MLKDVAFGMKLWRLRTTFHRLDLWQNGAEEAGLGRVNPIRALAVVKEKYGLARPEFFPR